MGISRIIVSPGFGGGGGALSASTETLISLLGGVQEGITGTPTWPAPVNPNGITGPWFDPTDI